LIQVWRREQPGGSTQVDPDGYLTGAPDLIVEIAASSASYDLHSKKDVYARNGVKEYIVWRTLDQQIDWFVLEHDGYRKLEQDENGILYRTEFQGLCLNVRAIPKGDMAQVLSL
jgi:Uma2 family endonuclease